MKRLLALVAALALSGHAVAQTTATPVVPGFNSTTGCNLSSQTVCFIQYGPGFNAQAQTTLSATSSTGNVVLGAGSTVVVSNAGPATAFVKLGGSTVTATTANTPVLVGFPVVLIATSAQTYIAGITASSTAALTITTGSGFPASGAAGGGGASSTITNLPNPADTNAGAAGANTIRMVIATGGATIPTNTAQVNGVTTLTGAGATGTGSQRQTVAQDTTTVAGSAPGTAGSPSTNVFTVQGIAGATGIPVSAASGAYVAGFSPDVTNLLSYIGPLASPNAASVNGQLATLNSVLTVSTATPCTTATTTNCTATQLFQLLVQAAQAPLAAGTNLVGKVGIDQTTDGTTNAVHLTAGTNLAGKFGIDQTTPGSTNNVTVGALASGGATPFHVLSAGTNNATLVSTGAHTLYSLVIAGTNTAIGDVRIYDSSGSPTCSSATGVVLNFPVITTTGLEGGLIVPIPPQGIALANGLAYCITGANADNDNTNAPTGINVNGAYK